MPNTAIFVDQWKFSSWCPATFCVASVSINDATATQKVAGHHYWLGTAGEKIYGFFTSTMPPPNGSGKIIRRITPATQLSTLASFILVPATPDSDTRPDAAITN